MVGGMVGHAMGIVRANVFNARAGRLDLPSQPSIAVQLLEAWIELVHYTDAEADGNTITWRRRRPRQTAGRVVLLALVVDVGVHLAAAGAPVIN